MSLLTVRNMFVEMTGRNDLVASGIALGADNFINEGQRTLDRMMETGKGGARYFVDLDLSQILVPLPNCRAVKKVFIGSGTERTELTKQGMSQLREDYADETSLLTTGLPAYYCPVWARPYPNIITATDFNQAWLLNDIIESGHESFNAILIMPPPDLDTYTLEVWGLFHSDKLINDEDVSYWTEEHPLLLAKAAAYQLESTYRNTEGMKDMMNGIDFDMKGIISDQVEEEIAEIDHMEG